MASQVPAKKNAAYTFYLGLYSQADTRLLQTNPTLAAGDVKVDIDGAGFANLGTLPVVTPAGGRSVKVVMAAGEMNGDNIQVVFSDAAGAEWCDREINIQTTGQQFDDLAAQATAAAIKTQTDKLTFDAGNRLASNLKAVNDQTAEAATIQISLNVMYRGSVTGVATATTLIDSGLTQAGTDHWKDGVVVFTSGVLKYQKKTITAFDPVTHKLTFNAFTQAPAGADTYVVV